ncbi:hypothetical protein FQR65_LT21001 [Abscondita terminalis]|nr:hypothetical protein FQR65_LT21001 [Abscondita terminalis]
MTASSAEKLFGTTSQSAGRCVRRSRRHHGWREHRQGCGPQARPSSASTSPAGAARQAIEGLQTLLRRGRHEGPSLRPARTSVVSLVAADPDTAGIISGLMGRPRAQGGRLRRRSLINAGRGALQVADEYPRRGSMPARLKGCDARVLSDRAPAGGGAASGAIQAGDADRATRSGRTAANVASGTGLLSTNPAILVYGTVVGLSSRCNPAGRSEAGAPPRTIHALSPLIAALFAVLGPLLAGRPRRPQKEFPRESSSACPAASEHHHPAPADAPADLKVSGKFVTRASASRRSAPVMGNTSGAGPDRALHAPSPASPCRAFSGMPLA